MCTVVLLHRILFRFPVWLAANRDETLGRASDDFAQHDTEGVRWLGPTDRVAGGTWLGVSASGLVAAVTNRFGRAPDPSRRSRGLIVPSLLRQGTALGAAAWLQNELKPNDFNGFHVVFADGHDAFTARAEAGSMVLTRAQGPVVLTERSFDAAPTEREEWLRPAVRALATAQVDAAEAWMSLLSVHRQGEGAPFPSPNGPVGFEGTCVHVPDRGYGTRSSAIVGFGGPGGTLLRTASGPPCTTAFDNRDDTFQSFLSEQTSTSSQ